jgi:RNA polymerase sigma-70 factor (family 1)
MIEYNTLDDLMLIDYLRADDEAAFTEIYNRYAEKLSSFANSKLYDLEDSKDIIHDIFVKLWTDRKQLHINKSLQAYFFTQVRHRVIDKIRKKLTQQDYDTLIQTFQRSIGSDVEQQIAAKEIKQSVNEALKKLSPRLREIYKLSREEELSISEIANILQLSEQTVKNQLTTALKHLRRSLPFFFIFL